MTDLRSRATSRVIDLVSEGEIVGLVDGAKSIYLDETPILNSDGTSNFEGVTYDFKNGTTDQLPLSGFPDVESEIKVGVLIRKDQPATRTISSGNVDAVRIRLHWDRLMNSKSNGSIAGVAVNYKISIKPTGGDWTVAKDDTVDGKATSAYERQHRIELVGTGPWDIKVERVTADSTNVRISDTMYWTSYTLITDEHMIYPSSAVSGLTFDSAYFGSSVPARAYDIKGLKVQVPTNYDPDTRVYTGIWDGTFKTAWTDNPAWCLYDLLTNSRYGLGREIYPATVDKWSFYDAAVYNDGLVADGYGGTEPRFVFNAVINDRQDAFHVANLVASVFRAMIYWASGTVFIVQDRPTDVSRLVTAANVVEGLFEYSGSALRARHNYIRVTWNDPNEGYRPNIEVVEDADMIHMYGIVADDMVAFGSTSRGQARRQGLWVLDTERYATEVVKYRAGIDHADAFPGEIVAIADPHYAGIRYGGRVVSATLNTITLDDTVDLAAGETYGISVTLPDGTLEERNITNTIPGSYTTLTLDSDLTDTPNAQAVWVITGTDVSPRQFRIVSNTEVEPSVYEINAVFHDPDKFARVEGSISFDDNVSQTIPSWKTMEPPEGPMGFTLSTANYRGDIVPTLFVSWNLPNSSQQVKLYEVSYRDSSGNWSTPAFTSVLSHEFVNLKPDWYQVRVRAINDHDTKSGWLTGMYLIPDDIYPRLASPNGLEIYDSGNSTVFEGRDVKIAWRPATYVGGYSEIADYGDAEQYVEYYTVKVYDTLTNNLVHQENTVNTEYTYTYEKNVEHSGPLRDIRFEVHTRDRWNADLSSPSSKLTVTNPAPALVNDLTVTGGLSSIIVSYTAPSDTDYKGVRVWVDTTPGFTPVDANLWYDGLDTLINLPTVTPSLEHYVRVAAYDVFGTTDLNMSGEYSVSPIVAGEAVPNFSFVGLVFTPNSPAADSIAWSAGSATVAADSISTTYALTAGDAALGAASALYIYYVSGETILRTSIDIADCMSFDRTVVAVYRGGTDIVVGAGQALIDGDNIIVGTIQADRLNVVQLSAITADLGIVTAGLIRSAATGERVEIHADKILVYDSANNERVRIGNLV